VRGGTVPTAEISYSFGWPRSDSHNVEDIEYLVQALGRIGELVKMKLRLPSGASCWTDMTPLLPKQQQRRRSY
jgi:hypothetical protein